MKKNAHRGPATGLALALALLLTGGSAKAATVYLKEGGRIEGALVSETDEEIVIDTAQGRVSVDRRRVERIDGAAAAATAPAPVPMQEERPFVRRRRYGWIGAEPDQAGMQVLSLDLGFASPIGGVTVNGPAGGGTGSGGAAGPAFGLQYLYYTSPRVGWGLEFHDDEFGSVDAPNLLPSYGSRVYGDTLLLLGVVKYSLTDRGPVRPFVLLGAGGYRATIDVDAQPRLGSAWPDTGTGESRRLVDASAAGLAASARLGLDFRFAAPWRFSLEAGWTGLTGATYGATPQGTAAGVTGVSGPQNYFTLTGRWGISF